ncbi:hypothetical protein SLEP1_g6889 [Rubroshorea leprosula]|uniref:Secreted protein n=1 Tax=Rubroshorea leprosula TaxID=152421 RepID=A0AAV5I6H4_9ROSI|nr:hypothetical protein SLEP1_g6889 [Rubroshorea leprosula]
MLLCLFAVSCSVRCRSDDLLFPPTDLWQHARGLPDLTPIATLLLVLRDYGRLIGLPLGIPSVPVKFRCTSRYPKFWLVQRNLTGTPEFDRYTRNLTETKS